MNSFSLKQKLCVRASGNYSAHVPWWLHCILRFFSWRRLISS